MVQDPARGAGGGGRGGGGGGGARGGGAFGGGGFGVGFDVVDGIGKVVDNRERG